MNVIARFLSRARPARRTNGPTAEILIIFCLTGLLVSLLAVRYGVDPTIGLSAIADAL